MQAGAHWMDAPAALFPTHPVRLQTMTASPSVLTQPNAPMTFPAMENPTIYSEEKLMRRLCFFQLVSAQDERSDLCFSPRLQLKKRPAAD